MSNTYYKSIQNLYVSQLNGDLQSLIKKELTLFFKNDLNLNKDNIIKELELAMNSRVSDLEDTIDIKKS